VLNLLFSVVCSSELVNEFAQDGEPFVQRRLLLHQCADHFVGALLHHHVD